MSSVFERISEDKTCCGHTTRTHRSPFVFRITCKKFIFAESERRVEITSKIRRQEGEFSPVIKTAKDSEENNDDADPKNMEKQSRDSILLTIFERW